MKSLFIILLLLTLSSFIIADNEFLVGVCTHLMSPPKPMDTLHPPLDMAIQAGIQAVRDTPYWSSVETIKGQLVEIYEFNDFMVALQLKPQLQKLFILGNGNQHYNQGDRPQGSNITAFGNYVNFITNLYKGKVEYWELYNEYEIAAPGDPNMATGYMQLAQHSIPIVRANDPNGKILGGCVTADGLRLGFVDRIVQQGILDLVDGLSIHPYVHCNGNENTPEIWFNWVNATDYRLRALRPGNNNSPIPLYITEMTWPTSHPSTCGQSLDTHAAYLARAYFLARVKPNIKAMFWYDIFNDGLDYYDREHNYGLLDHNYVPKPAYHTLKAITPFISHYTFDASNSSLVSPPLYRLAFHRGDKQVLVAWSSSTSTIQTTITTQSVVPLDLVKVWYTTPCATNEWVDSPFKWNCIGTTCTANVTVGKFPIIFDVTPIKCKCL